MIRKRFSGTAGAVAVLVVASLGLASPSFAAEISDDTVAALVRLNPGVTAERLLSDAEHLARQLDTTPEAVLKQQLGEAKESAAAASSKTGGVGPQSSGGGGTVILGNAVRKGDIFVSPASTLFIEHGHAGIYYSLSTIVEAPGLNKNSRSFAAASLVVGKGAVKQLISTSQANHDKAANYAYNSMRGKPYNSSFANNKYVPAATYNCSQLVWGAYKQTVSIDLDSNGGLGVYPYNIKDSSKTVTYATL